MLDFRIGDRVSFQPEGQPMVIGILTRYNKKTVTVVTDEGARWNVAPQFLRADRDAGKPRDDNLPALPHRNE
jgi:hypothetical protein